MKLAMEIFHDDEVEQWGYSVPSLSIVGTGCHSREEARLKGIEAVRFVLDSGDQDLDGEVVMLNVDIGQAVEAS